MRIKFQRKNYNDYIFNANTGYLFYYDHIKDEFLTKSERFESDIL